jgi:hypothetical protein
MLAKPLLNRSKSSLVVFCSYFQTCSASKVQERARATVGALIFPCNLGRLKNLLTLLLPPSYSTPHNQTFHTSPETLNRQHGLHRLRLRCWPHPPEQLGQDPQLHCWVSNYPTITLFLPFVFMHLAFNPPSNDENIWSVLMRRLKTPLSEYKPKRLSQL